MAYAALIAVCFFLGDDLSWDTNLDREHPAAVSHRRPLRYFRRHSVIAATLGGVQLPRGRELLYTAICRIICIGVGNSLWRSRKNGFQSGLAALFYTTSPFWMVGVDTLLPGEKTTVHLNYCRAASGGLGSNLPDCTSGYP